MALQKRVENAVKHNEISIDKPLTIRLHNDAQYLIVENTLQRKAASGETSSGLGLENIIRRYQFLSDVPVEVSEAGEHFIVKLPIISSAA